MAENKEQLKLLLEFVAEILEQEGNEWFHDELAVLFSKKIISEKDIDIKLSAVTFKELGSIDKYLNEGLVPIIDYSGITDERVKLQLERDAIEMGKSRLSNFTNKISFQSFCKYAHFQSEELVNYYFFKVSNGDVEYVKNDITAHINRPPENLSNKLSITAIPHGLKQWALSNKISLDPASSYTLSNISKVRNLEIHRSSTSQIESGIQEFIDREDYNRIYESIIHLKNKIISEVEIQA